MRASEREAVLDLLEAAFEERELFARFMDTDPAFDPANILLALDDDRPVSSVQIFSKQIRLRDAAVPLGGIGSVATHPDYRKQGLAYELLRRSETAMRERGMPLALLFAVLWDFYGRLGWVQIPVRQLALHRREASAEMPRGIRARDFEPGDLEAISALYERYASGFEGTTLRDASYWRGQLAYSGSPEQDFRIALEGDRPVAYARRVWLGAPLAMEFAHEPGAEDALAALVTELCPDDRAMLMRLPAETPLENALARRGLSVDRVDDPTFMWRVLDAAALARMTGLPESSGAALLDELIRKPPVHYWVSDRF
jgi:predicted acetyltransferase